MNIYNAFRTLWISLSLLLLGLNPGWAQETFTPKLLQEDLSHLKEILLGVSPKLTEDDRQWISDLVAFQKKELEEKSLNSMEFFNFLAEIDFQTKFDEHASMSISEEVLMPLLEKSKLFPLPLKILANRVLVNSEDAAIPFGSVLHSINGVPMDTLFKSFTRKYEDTFIQKRLESTFSFIYLLKKGSPALFHIEYTQPSTHGKRAVTELEGLDLEAYRERFQQKIYPVNKDQLTQLTHAHYFPKDHTFYLQLNSFSWDMDAPKSFLNFFRGDSQKFDQLFKALFKEISSLEVENLILDLRFNGGGNVMVPGILFKYLAKEAFHESVWAEVPDFDIPEAELISEIGSKRVKDPKKVGKYLQRLSKRFQREDSTFIWPVIENEVTHPHPFAFKGNVYVLVGGRSASASAYFAALFKANQRGTIVGEVMGGDYQSLTAGEIFTYQLPHTKIELETPIMVVNFSEELSQKIEGNRIQPDVRVPSDDAFQYFLSKKDIEVAHIMKQVTGRE